MGAPCEQLRAPKDMKKLKSKKKPHKIHTEQRDVRPKVVAATETEILELAPQTPLGIESRPEFHAEVHKD